MILNARGKMKRNSSNVAGGPGYVKCGARLKSNCSKSVIHTTIPGNVFRIVKSCVLCTFIILKLEKSYGYQRHG